MNKLAWIIATLLLASCSPKIVEVVKTERVDSVIVEVHERLVKDTVSIEIPVEVEKIVTRDTVSHLENRYARSDASVEGGFLFHSLESKPQIIYVPVEVPVADTTTTQVHSDTNVVQVTMEESLTKWQMLQLSTFWFFFVTAIALAIWTFRKQIITIIKNFL